MHALVQDLKYGLRVMSKNPGFVAVAVLILALGVGANTAIFSVVHAVLLDPLPYSDPSRLVLVKEVLPKIGPKPLTVSAPDVVQIQKLNKTLEGAAGFLIAGFELSGENEAERVAAGRVNSNLFTVLGVRAVVGRGFTTDEDQPGRLVAILSHGLWQRRFGGNSNVTGRTITLNRRSYTVVGVMPQSFVFPLQGMSQGGPADLWVPMGFTNDELSQLGDNFDFSVIGRLKLGVALRQANADLESVARAILETYPKQGLGDFQLGVVAQPLADQVTGPVRPMLLMLLGAVGFILLIACANVANLLLTRAAGRQKEMAVRLAIGAGRGRLLRQLLVEGMLLSFTGGVLGVLFAFWIKEALVAALPGSIPRFHAIELSLPVLLFTFALAVITGLAFGIVPGLSAIGTDLSHSLKEGGRSATQGPEHHRLRATLVVAEVALSVVLLIGAGLLVRSFQRVIETHPGFQPEHVLTVSLSLPGSQYNKAAQITSFYQQLLERLRQMPGAKAAGASTDLPLEASWTHLFTPEGYQPPAGATLNVCSHSVIHGDYLQTMSIPLLRGRYFTDQDQPGATHVLIVSESLAKRYWPNQDPIGKRLKWGPPQSTAPWLTVVGVAGDIKQGALDVATIPHTYEPYLQLTATVPPAAIAQGAVSSLRVAVRAEGDPATVATNLRAAVWGMDRQLAVARVRTMEQVIGQSTAARRFNVFVLGAFAVLALLLAAIGIYGVLAYSVTRRTHEIGVRMALGARGGDVVRLVVGQGALLTGMGIAIGALGALVLTRFLEGVLYEVRPTDPVTFAAVLAVLGGVALAASYLPARRATQIQPTVALRHE